MSQPFWRGSIYQFRRAVPDELVDLIGKVEIKQSLKTRDPNEARLLQAEAYAASERLFASARAQLADVSRLTPDDARHLASRWFREETALLERTGRFTDWLQCQIERKADGSRGYVRASATRAFERRTDVRVDHRFDGSIRCSPMQQDLVTDPQHRITRLSYANCPKFVRTF